MIYIAVVSHHHARILEVMCCLPGLINARDVRVLVLDNVGESGLRIWCEKFGFEYVLNNGRKGFGENNNILFGVASGYSDFNIDNDWFVVLNPDVGLTSESLGQLCVCLDDRYPLCAINLHKDELGLVSDDSIRHFPSFIDFVSSFLFGINRTKIDKSSITQPCDVDWAAGSFLLFKASHYARLGGFDTSYFMYCEDVDICFRSAIEFGCKVRYLPHIKARHLARHGNRKIFSKHFYCHLTSSLRFLWRSRKPRKLLSKSKEWL